MHSQPWHSLTSGALISIWSTVLVLSVRLVRSSLHSYAFHNADQIHPTSLLPAAARSSRTLFLTGQSVSPWGLLVEVFAAIGTVSALEQPSSREVLLLQRLNPKEGTDIQSVSLLDSSGRTKANPGWRINL